MTPNLEVDISVASAMSEDICITHKSTLPDKNDTITNVFDNTLRWLNTVVTLIRLAVL